MSVGSCGGATIDAIATATPYPWPYHGAFDPNHCALVVCMDKSWRRSGLTADRADEHLGRLARSLQALGGVVVTVTAAPLRPGLACLDDPGAYVRDGTTLTAVDFTVEAGGTSAFYASGLDDILRRAERCDLMVAGWGLEGPVHSTLRAANDRGYECLLVPDASTPLDDELADASCSMVQLSGGIFGAVAFTNEVLALLRGHRDNSC